MSEKHGGARPGAGRPTERVARDRARVDDAIKNRIARRAGRILGNLFKLADGVTVQEPNKDGTLEVYTKPPDLKANIHLLDRLLGRVTQPVEVSGKDGEAIKITATVKDAAAKELLEWRDEMTKMLSSTPSNSPKPL